MSNYTVQKFHWGQSPDLGAWFPAFPPLEMPMLVHEACVCENVFLRVMFIDLCMQSINLPDILWKTIEHIC